MRALNSTRRSPGRLKKPVIELANRSAILKTGTETWSFLRSMDSGWANPTPHNRFETITNACDRVTTIPFFELVLELIDAVHFAVSIATEPLVRDRGISDVTRKPLAANRAKSITTFARARKFEKLETQGAGVVTKSACDGQLEIACRLLADERRFSFF